jgi:hypothetical protein
MISIGVELSNFKLTEKYLKLLEGHIEQLTTNELLILINSSERLETNIPRLIKLARTKGVTKGVNESILSYLEAKYLFNNQGKAREALNILETISLSGLDTIKLKVGYYLLLAKIHEKLKNFEIAFKTFEQMNRILKSLLSPSWRNNDELPKFRRLGPISSSSNRTGYIPPINIAFLIGSPRSGTTLLERVVDSQSQILTLGEKPLIDEVCNKIKLDGYSFPDDIKYFSEEYLNELREYYFLQVNKYSNGKSLSDYKLLLDKNPLYIIKLPLLLMLFPQAKIILAVRHPLDCILSCYQQSFRLTLNLSHYLDLKSSFERYRDIFDMYEEYKESMQWSEYRVFYEKLVGDFENQIEGILGFLEVDVEKQAYINFQETSNKSIVNTPSQNQVKQGIYQKSSYKWQNYRKFMEPHFKMVLHHIEKFGYEVKDH